MAERKVQIRHNSVGTHSRRISQGGRLYEVDENTHLLHLVVDGKPSTSSGVIAEDAEELLVSSLFDLVKPEPPKSKTGLKRKLRSKRE